MRDRQADGNSHCRCVGVIVEPCGWGEAVDLLYIPTLTIWSQHIGCDHMKCIAFLDGMFCQ